MQPRHRRGHVSTIDFTYPKCFNVVMTLTKSDRAKIIDKMKEIFVTKEELGTAIANLVKQLPSKKEQMADKIEILTAIKDLKSEDKAHKMLHSNLGEDVPKIQQQIQHLFKTFEIKDPTSVVASY